MATFGDRVQAERKAKAWSHQRLADEVTKIAKTTCPKVTIEKIENRSAEYSKWARSIALALGVNPEWLITGEGSKIIRRSIDRRMQQLEPVDYNELHDYFDALIDERLRRNAGSSPDS